jgi:hypothetical protein
MPAGLRRRARDQDAARQRPKDVDFVPAEDQGLVPLLHIFRPEYRVILQAKVLFFSTHMEKA